MPIWRVPAMTILSLAWMGIGVALSFLVVRKLISERLPDSGSRAAPFYMIPGLYGGMFIIMLVVWGLG